MISSRVNDLSEFSTGKTTYEGDLGSRYALYSISLNSFAKSPIVGSSHALLGGHSYVFDNMGHFGLLGIIAMFIMYRQIFRVFYKPFRGAAFFGYIIFTLGLAILLAVLNPKDNLFILTFLIPVVVSFFSKSMKEA